VLIAFVSAAVAAVVALLATTPSATGQQQVIIYSSNDDTLHRLVFPAFTKETGIAVEPVSAGSGVIIKRIQTEKDRPAGDIIWGVSRSLLQPRTLRRPQPNTGIRPISGSATICTSW
jgi:iron(III) transport system substrate-binding protein